MTPLVPGAPASSVSSGRERARYVRGMFARIVPWYDRLNRLLSLGLDQRWRRRTLELLGLEADAELLDACCGTGDLSLLAAAGQAAPRVTGSDFCEPLVREARRKSPGGPAAPRWLLADTLALPFPDGVFHGAVVGFGIRNLGDLGLGLQELYRVLRPGGRLALLEFSTPRLALLRIPMRFYLRHVLPRIGGLASGADDAYRYLPETVLRFPDQAALERRMVRAGFRRVRHEDLLMGVVAIHLGEKEPTPSESHPIDR